MIDLKIEWDVKDIDGDIAHQIIDEVGEAFARVFGTDVARKSLNERGYYTGTKNKITVVMK